jgi:hypothetical protein
VNASSILERNLLALSAGHPRLSRLLGATGPSPEAAFLRSRQGTLVPALAGGERPLALHSTVDPHREGRRYFELYRGAGYLVFLGLGGGYQVLPFLGDEGVCRILIVEGQAAFLRAVLERIDLRRLLLDSRVHLELEQGPERIRDFLLSDYLPAIHGNLSVVPLRPSVEARREYYEGLLDCIRAAVEQVAEDYSVQARFGRRWFTNTLANLEAAEKATAAVKPTRRALVVGAGPSLEGQLQTLRELRREALLIASDTSLPALLACGIRPDLVLSIDCQQISYHHFLQGLPEEVTLALDLASPPVLARRAPRVLFFASRHPLSLYLSAHFRPFPPIDTSGGSVAHAAVHLAQQLGAREIYLLGLDFSYPDGKAYCRGTYLYSLFGALGHRLAPLPSLFFSFMLRGQLHPQPIPGGVRYTSAALLAYKSRLESLLAGSESRIIQLPGRGLPLQLPTPPAAGRHGTGRIMAAGAPLVPWRSFLERYLEGLRALPEPEPPLSRYLQKLPEEQRALWLTLLPAAAALRERLHRQGHELLREVQSWSVGMVSRCLDR